MNINSNDALKIKDITKSPEASIMIIHMYDDVKMKYDKLTKDYEYEKLKSNDRFVATLVLFIAQFVLALGIDLLTTDRDRAFIVLAVGALQSIFGLYLTFKK